MDPNVNLSEQIALAREILNDDEDATTKEMMESSHRLAELVVELNEWIRKGGFLPTAWERT